MTKIVHSMRSPPRVVDATISVAVSGAVEARDMPVAGAGANCPIDR
jgi:hypothetical protein